MCIALQRLICDTKYIWIFYFNKNKFVNYIRQKGLAHEYFVKFGTGQCMKVWFPISVSVVFTLAFENVTVW